MSLEDIERGIYEPKFDSENARRASRPVIKTAVSSSSLGEDEVSEEWSDRGKKRRESGLPEEERSFFEKKATLFVLGLIVAALVGGTIFFAASIERKLGNVDLALQMPSTIYRGVPFEMSVSISNELDELIREGTLTLQLPPGVVSLGGLHGQEQIVVETVGDIGAGSIGEKTFTLLPIGSPRSVQKIPMTFAYTTGVRGRFEVNKTQTLTIAESPIVLDIKAPESILRGSEFEINITYRNTSEFDFPDVELEAKYPTGFTFKSASLNPDSLNNVWRLGALQAGSTGELSITGNLEGNNEGRFGLPIAVSAVFLGKKYPITEEIVDLAMAPSPIKLDVLVNSRTDYVARIGDQMRYTVEYRNESGIALADVVITAHTVGELFDFNTVRTQGNIDYTAQSITWNASNVPGLRIVDPGASGFVSFEVQLKPVFDIKRLNDKNFFVRVNADIDSPSVPYYLSGSEVSAAASLETKVAGLALLDVSAFYRDAISGIANSGTLPPKVGQQTDYTIHWAITNYSTDIKNVDVKAFLAPGVAWTGIVKSNVASVPLYNDRTQEVTWKIDKVNATKGILSDPVEAIFQVRATPNQTHAGAFQPLIGAATFTATDEFTGFSLTSSDGAIDTSLPDDPTVGQSGGIVVP